MNIRSDGLESRIASTTDWKRVLEEEGERQREDIENQSRAAMDAARENGLDLPPVMTSVPNVKVVDGVIYITAVNNNRCDEEHLFSTKVTSF